MIKKEGLNEGVMSFSPSPAGLPMYNNLNWSSLIESPSPDMKVKSATYDPQTGKIAVEF